MLKPFVQQIVYEQIFVWGNKKRLHIDSTAKMVNTLFNTMSGDIYVGEYVFAGHNVSVITGCHDYMKHCKDRMYTWRESGNDIVIDKGVWIGSNAVIIGPCKIGENAVIGAGAVVISDVEPNTVVGGIPAKIIKSI